MFPVEGEATEYTADEPFISTVNPYIKRIIDRKALITSSTIDLVESFEASRLPSEYKDNVEEEEEMAVRIQKVARGNLTRSKMQDDHKPDEEPSQTNEGMGEEEAAVMIQKVARGNMVRSQKQENPGEAQPAQATEPSDGMGEDEAAVMIQKVARGKMARANTGINKGEAGEADTTEAPSTDTNGAEATPSDSKNTEWDEDKAAAHIQAVAKGRKVRQEITKSNEAATKVQKLARGRQSRRELEEKKKAAARIQSIERSRKARKEFQEKKEAAVKIQSVARGNLTRKQKNEAE